MGIICPPPVGIRLTDLLNIGGGGAVTPLAPPVPASLSSGSREVRQFDDDIVTLSCLMFDFPLTLVALTSAPDVSSNSV